MDVWYKASMDDTGFEYYTYILVYFDDIIILDKTLKKYMDMLEESYTVKQSSIVEPKIYIGADVGKVYYPDSSYSCTMCSKYYTKEIIYNVKKKLEERNLCSN